jgi:hypothetical protein
MLLWVGVVSPTCLFSGHLCPCLACCCALPMYFKVLETSPSMPPSLCIFLSLLRAHTHYLYLYLTYLPLSTSLPLSLYLTFDNHLVSPPLCFYSQAVQQQAVAHAQLHQQQIVEAVRAAQLQAQSAAEVAAAQAQVLLGLCVCGRWRSSGLCVLHCVCVPRGFDISSQMRVSVCACAFSSLCLIARSRRHVCVLLGLCCVMFSPQLSIHHLYRCLGFSVCACLLCLAVLSHTPGSRAGRVVRDRRAGRAGRRHSPPAGGRRRANPEPGSTHTNAGGRIESGCAVPFWLMLMVVA